LRFKTPDTDQSLLKTLIGQRAVVLSESLAIRQGFIVGDSFPLPTPAGELLLPIAGIYRDYSNDRGSVMMDRALLDEIYGAQPPTNLALYVAPDQDPATLREEMLAEISSSRSVLLFTQKDLRQEVVRIFDSTFSITWALEAIAALMAMAGIAICLYTLFLEQRPDWHMLRILGTSTPQLRGIAMTQAAIIGFISQFLGLLLGLAMAMVLVFVINVQSFGWTIEFRPPWMILGVSLVLVPLFTCSAGWLSLKRVFRNHSDLGLPGQAG
jgi:putative ABC transport system permease protein